MSHLSYTVTIDHIETVSLQFLTSLNRPILYISDSVRPMCKSCIAATVLYRPKCPHGLLLSISLTSLAPSVAAMLDLISFSTLNDGCKTSFPFSSIDSCIHC